MVRGDRRQGLSRRHLVDMLIRYEMFSVRISDLVPTILLDHSEENGAQGAALRFGRARYVSADLRDKAQVLRAIEGAEVVFHMAAPDSSINNHQLHYSVDVLGTKNVIDACIELKATKAECEAAIIKAHGTDDLLTCSLRPSGIFGPGDKLFVPTLAAAGRAGKLKFIVGDGDNVHDFTYVENVAHAHICTERALALEGKVANRAAGQVNLDVLMCNNIMKYARAVGWSLINIFMEGLKRTLVSYPHLKADHQSKRKGPSKPSTFLGSGRVANILLWKDKKHTLVTLLFLIAIYNFLASQSTIVAALSKILLLTSIFLFIHGSLPEKVYASLTFSFQFFKLAYFMFLSDLQCILKEYNINITFGSSNGNLTWVAGCSMFGYKIEKVPPSCFHISEEKSHRFALTGASSWNFAANILKSLCKGSDWMVFLKVILLLLILSFAGAISLRSLFVIGLPFTFVAFYVYENNEEAIDGLFMEFASCGCKLKSDVTKKVVGSKKND